MVFSDSQEGLFDRLVAYWALLVRDMALLIEFRALLIEFWAFFIADSALLRENMVFLDRTWGVFCDERHKYICHQCVCHEPDESSEDPEESSQDHEGGLFLIRGWVVLMGDGAPVGETGGISL